MVPLARMVTVLPAIALPSASPRPTQPVAGAMAGFAAVTSRLALSTAASFKSSAFTAAAEKIFESLGLMEYAKESGWNGNPKGELQVRCQARGVMPSYELVHVAGKAHEPVFTVKVSVAGVGSAVASAGSRKKADSLAAAQMLEKL